MKTNLEKSLIPWIRRLRLQRAVVWSCWGLGLGSALGWVVGLAAIADTRLVQAEFVWLVLFQALLGSLTFGLTAYLLPVQLMRAARAFDRALDLQERLSTALELQRRVYLGQKTLVDLQIQDAQAAVNGIQIRQRMRLKASRPGLILGVLFLLAVVPTAWLSTDSFLEASNKRRAQSVLEEQAAEVAQLIEQIQASDTLDPEIKSDTVTALEASIEQLESAPSLEAGLAALDAAEQSLRAMSDSSAAITMERLQVAAQSLQGKTPGSLVESLAEGSVQAAAEQLQSIDLAQISDEERTALASTLQGLSEAILDTSSGLSEDLATAAEALAAAELPASEQALEAAAESLQAIDQGANQSAEIADLIDTLKGAQGALASANQNISEAGEPSDPESGPMAVIPSNQETGGTLQVQQPGGSGRGDPTGSTQTGADVGTEPIDQANDPGDLGLVEYSEIYSPFQAGIDSLPGESVILPSSDLPRNLVTGTTDPSAPVPGISRVPYVEVYPYYEGLWRQAIDTGAVPPDLHQLVQRYFVGLEP